MKNKVLNLGGIEAMEKALINILNNENIENYVIIEKANQKKLTVCQRWGGVITKFI